MPKLRSEAPQTSPYHHGALRDELLRLALLDLETLGAEAVSLRGLASRAGVSKTAPYRHFKDRDDLLAALRDQGWKQLRTAMEMAATSADSPRAGLAAMGSSYVEFALSHPGMYRLLFSGKAAREHENKACTDADAAFELLKGQLDACRLDGWMSAADPQRLALAYWSLVHGAADLALEGIVQAGDSCSPTSFWRQVVEVMQPPWPPTEQRTR